MQAHIRIRTMTHFLMQAHKRIYNNDTLSNAGTHWHNNACTHFYANLKHGRFT